MPGERVVVGRIGRPHGVRGSVRAIATGPTLAALPEGTDLVATGRGGAARPLRLAARAGTRDRPVLTFEGVADRSAAAELTGAVLSVAADMVPRLEDPDTFYVRDLLGCRLLEGERDLGTVIAIRPGPANDVIELEDGTLVPFTGDAVLDVDPAAGRIRIRPGLIGGEGGA
jgi:16S rRNA processing protein RimM